MTRASRSTRFTAAPASVINVPATSRPPTTAALKSSPTHGLRRREWIFAKTSGTTSSLAMP